MQQSKFGERLKREFEARRAKNRRYSLRAFAAFLEIDHSSLSQILRGSRRASADQIRSWAGKLGMAREEADLYVATEGVPHRSSIARQGEIRHWTDEAFTIIELRIHWEILKLCRQPGFQADCRWIARQTRESVDNVNLALSRLLRLGLLELTSTGEWKDRTGLCQLTELEFRRLALLRVRQWAAEFQAELRKP